MLLSRKKTALLIVDMQNAFCKAEGSMVQAGIGIGPLAAAIDPCHRLVAAARNAGVPAMAVWDAAGSKKILCDDSKWCRL